MRVTHPGKIIALVAVALFYGCPSGSLIAAEKGETIELAESRYPNSGDLYMRGRYLTKIDGTRKQFGPWHYYSTDGTLVNFHGDDGRMYAPTIVINTDGNLVMVGLQQEDGTKNGPEIEVYPEFQSIRTLTSYKAGVLDGPWIYFGIDGSMVARKVFSDGKIVTGWSWSEQGKEAQVIINGSGSITYAIRGVVGRDDRIVSEEYLDGELRKVSTTEVESGKVEVLRWIEGKWESTQ